ncbi:MAG: TolC family protein [Myxococcota bacterium]|jgi:hypothetical protein
MTSAAVVLLTVIAAAGQAPEPLGEDEAIRLALAGSREIPVLEGVVAAQEKLVRYARYDVRNPELRLGDISTKYFEPGENKELEVGLRWHPPRLGELGMKEQEERVGLWERKSGARLHRLDLVARVRKAYARVAMFQEYSELASRQEELEGLRLKAVEGLVNAGERPFMALVSARKRQLKSKMTAAMARQQLAESKEKLAALAGVSGIGMVVVQTPPLSVPEKSVVSRVASANRPEAELDRQRAELVRREYGYERYRLIPWFTFVQIDYRYESLKPDWGELKLGIELPLFNYRTGERASTAILRDQIPGAAAAMAGEIERRVLDALAAYNTARADYMALAVNDAWNGGDPSALVNEAKKHNLMADDVLELELSDIELKELRLKAGLELSDAAVALCLAAGVESWDGLSR